MNRSLHIVALLVGVLLAAVTASADEFAAAEGLALTSFEIRGVPDAVSDALKSGLALEGEKSLLGRKHPVFESALLDADVRRAQLFLARQGYPWARVAPRVEFRGQGREVGVTLDVALGPTVQIDSVRVSGVPADLDKEIRRAVGPRAGTRFVDANVDAAAGAAALVLQDAGYAMATVEPRVEFIDSIRVRLRLVAHPGTLYVFGSTRIDGLPPDLVPLATRSVDIDRGARYSPESLDSARKNLQLLNLFRQIRVSAVPARAETLDVLAELSPREPRTIEARVGYFSEDQFRTRLSWEGRNTFGGGRGLKVMGSYSIYNQEARISTWWPTLFGPRTREELSFAGTSVNEDAFDQWQVGLQATTWYRRSHRTTTSQSLQFGYVDSHFKDGSEPDLVGLMTILESTVSLDRTDDRLRPTRGWLTWGKGDWSPDFLPSEAPFILGQVGATLYSPRLPRSVIATKWSLGLARPIGATGRLLPDARFYAGGANSNRGFERRKLGPRNESGDPVGGQALVETQTEIRTRLVWKLEGAVFLDVGQVWALVEEMRFGSLEPSAGGALMVDTPVGPMRVDIGFRLRDPGNDPSWVLHFLIGNPF
jgi:outer membrane protein insertion porin family